MPGWKVQMTADLTSTLGSSTPSQNGRMYSSLDDTGMLKVLRFLQAHDSEYLSGQDLSDVLHISRVSVWKHIKKIQELGYAVRSRQKLGYMLEPSSDLLLPWEVTAGLETKMMGKKAFYLKETASTQDAALEMARSKEYDGAVIIAQSQTAGRGRAKKRWASPVGGIWMSVILHPEFDVRTSTLFPLAASLAVSDAIEQSGIKTELKWPNDVMIRGKKVAGILVDASLESNRIEYLVLGVGINFDVDMQQIKREAGKAVTSIKEHNGKAGAVSMVQSFLQRLEEIYSQLHDKRTDRIISEWTGRSSTIGSNVEVSTAGGTARGKAVKIGDDGALVLDNMERIIAGDVVHLKR